MSIARRCFACTLTLLLATPLLVAAQQDAGDFVPPADLGPGWYARIDTSKGRILARLLPEQAPQSVAHFAGLASGTLEWFDRASGKLQKGPYYDGIKIHKAIAGQRIEAGCPEGTGRAAPEILVPPEVGGPINFNAPGRLGMTADTGAISGVMFFATASAQPWLTGSHPCFGVVVSGIDVITQLSQEKTYSNGRPIEQPVIERIRIFGVGDPEPLNEPRPYEPVFNQLEARPGMRQTEP